MHAMLVFFLGGGCAIVEHPLLLQLRSEMAAERGIAVLECVCMDDAVLKGIGAA